MRPPRIVQAPVAFECVLHETLETASRYVFIGRVQWLAVRDGLVDTAGVLSRRALWREFLYQLPGAVCD